jgi:hypothetical protein
MVLAPHALHDLFRHHDHLFLHQDRRDRLVPFEEKLLFLPKTGYALLLIDL